MLIHDKEKTEMLERGRGVKDRRRLEEPNWEEVCLAESRRPQKAGGGPPSMNISIYDFP